MEFDEAMTTGKVYTNMDEFHAWCACRESRTEAEGSAVAFKGKESEVLLTVA